MIECRKSWTKKATGKLDIRNTAETFKGYCHAVIVKKSSIQKQMAAFPVKNGHFEFWLPIVNVLRNQFAELTKEMAGTILIAQNQVKDGFLAVSQTPQP